MTNSYSSSSAQHVQYLKAVVVAAHKSSHNNDSRVLAPVLELLPLAEGSEHRYFRWSARRSVSVQSEFSIDAIPSKRVVPTTSTVQRSMVWRSTTNTSFDRRCMTYMLRE